MPLFTNELLVKMTIEEEQQPQQESSGKSSEESEASGTDALVSIVVEKILEILKERDER